MSEREKVLADILALPPEERRWVRDQLEGVDEFHPDEVPTDVQDEIMAEVERRMADQEANPQPMLTADEAIDRILARRASRRVAS